MSYVIFWHFSYSSIYSKDDGKIKNKTDKTKIRYVLNTFMHVFIIIYEGINTSNVYSIGDSPELLA